jgi:hypothetical protein
MKEKTTEISLISISDTNIISNTISDTNTDNINLDQIIFDFSMDVNVRVKAFQKYYEINKENTIELLSRLIGMYQFSGTKSIEFFLKAICECNISSFLKLESAKSLLCFTEEEEDINKDDSEEFKNIKYQSNIEVRLRNITRKTNAYKILDCVCNNLENLATPCKIEAVCLLMECSEYKEQSLSYFIKIIGDNNIETEYRYKVILSLEHNDKYEKWNIPDREFFLEQSLLHFINNIKNMTMYRILAGQYLLQKLKVDNILSQKIQNILLNFAKDEFLDYNLRADAADTLLSLADDDIKKQAKDIIITLGTSGSINRTLFDNSQNVHSVDVEKSVSGVLGILTTLPDMKVNNQEITFNYINKQIEDVLSKRKKDMYKKRDVCKYCNSFVDTSAHIKKEDAYFCNNECYTLFDKEEKILISLNRINLDRILYSKYNQSLINIITKVWTYINYDTNKEYKESMIERLLEELYDMSGTCSSGFASRLINVISGFGEFNIHISWEEQIVANFTGRLNAAARKIIEPDSVYYNKKHRDIVKLYMKSHNLLTKRNTSEELNNKETSNMLIDKYLLDNKTEKIILAVEEFYESVLNEITIVSSNYYSRQNFIKFFQDNMPIIREELYNEFKTYIDDTQFDMAFRKAISVYEGCEFIN